MQSTTAPCHMQHATCTCAHLSGIFDFYKYLSRTSLAAQCVSIVWDFHLFISIGERVSLAGLRMRKSSLRIGQLSVTLLLISGDKLCHWLVANKRKRPTPPRQQTAKPPNHWTTEKLKSQNETKASLRDRKINNRSQCSQPPATMVTSNVF